MKLITIELKQKAKDEHTCALTGAAPVGCGCAAGAAAGFACGLWSVFCFLLLFQPSAVFLIATDSSRAYCTSCMKRLRLYY